MKLVYLFSPRIRIRALNTNQQVITPVSCVIYHCKPLLSHQYVVLLCMDATVDVLFMANESQGHLVGELPHPMHKPSVCSIDEEEE
jgi:hypothetical protein